MVWLIDEGKNSQSDLELHTIRHGPVLGQGVYAPWEMANI
jgi:hypothetical protein